MPIPANERLAREYAARRFPALADAPVIGARVCQYTSRGDTHFLVAQHPERADWWLARRRLRATGSSTARRSASTSPTASRAGAQPEPFHALGPREGHAGLRTAGALSHVCTTRVWVPARTRIGRELPGIATVPGTGAVTRTVQRPLVRAQLNADRPVRSRHHAPRPGEPRRVRRGAERPEPRRGRRDAEHELGERRRGAARPAVVTRRIGAERGRAAAPIDSHIVPGPCRASIPTPAGSARAPRRRSRRRTAPAPRSRP